MIHGNPCTMLEIHDIDEIRRAYDAVAQVNNKLKILSSITRHDILNRVMVVSAYSEMIRIDTTDESLKKRIDAIHQSSNEIQALIEFTGHYQDLGETAPSWQNIDHIMNINPIKTHIKDITFISSLGDLEIYADRMLEKVHRSQLCMIS
jgi:light-regulated signal transduction histidine kinase (bacteriophytochrome)